MKHRRQVGDRQRKERFGKRVFCCRNHANRGKERVVRGVDGCGGGGGSIYLILLNLVNESGHTGMLKSVKFS